MSKNKSRILLRADGNSKIGLGHVMRLLGLCEFISNDFNCVFLIRQPDIKLKEIIESFCEILMLKSITLKDEMSELDALLCSSDIVVLDGYDFNENYQQYIKSKAHKLVMIDDKGDQHYYADLIINHGGGYLKNIYRTETYTNVLVGFKYLILRKAFINAAARRRNIAELKTVFICMGGSDPFDITVKVLEACINTGFIKNIIVVVGNAYSNLNKLKNLINNNKKIVNILLENNVDAKRMIELIESSEIAICPASSVSLEVCCVTAGLITGTVIDNQNAIHTQLIENNCCVSVGDFNTATISDITKKLKHIWNMNMVTNLIKNQQLAIDGYSDRRILHEFKLLCK